jgi:hypothetical protein
MKNLLKLSIAMIFASIIFVGCSSEDNPLVPNDPDPVINTPKYMRVESITVTRFPELKSNGDKWDFHVFTNSPTRRPDIYVELNRQGSSDFVYRSDIREDAILETANSSYFFTEPASSNSGSLPYNVPMTQTYNINLMDDDGISADDFMGNVIFTPVNYYANDNAINFHETFSNGETTIKIDGRWIY